jgi:hypothetical protein
MKKLLLLFSMFPLLLNAQTNPATSNLPISLTSQTGATLPNYVAIHRFGTAASAIPLTRITTDGNADLPNTTTNNSGGWIAETSNGISILASGSNAAGAILMEFNTTANTNVQVSWVAWTVLDQTSRTNSIALQYRVGESGTWTNVDTPTSSVYATGTAGRANGVSYTQTLPAGANNQPIVQVRWVYWESAGSAGSRDRLGIDEVSITGNSTLPTISTSINTISGINYLEGNGPSTAISYNLSGSNLSPASGDISVTAPTNFELSISENGTFTDILSVPYTGGGLSSTPIFVRLKTGLITGNYGGVGSNIVNSGGTATTVNIPISGTVSCGNAVNISIVRSTVPVQAITTSTTSVTIAGRITAILGTSKIYVQDNTGGIAVFSSNIVSSNGLVLGDSIRLTGIAVRFNGEIQLTTISCILKVSSGTVPIPVVFNANTPPVGTTINDFLCTNEGRLIKIISSNFSSSGTFTSAMNYGIVLCNQQDATEIRIDAGSTGLIGATIPNTVTQDITGVLGRYIVTASGVNTTDKLQIFPRSLSDLVASSTSCVGPSSCGVTTFTDSPTKLDIVNWNVEWLGHPSNGPSQSGSGDAVQIANAQSVLNGTGADLFLLTEICQYNSANPSDNTTAFGKLIEGLNTAFGVNAYSGECSAAVSNSVVDPNAQRVCVIYKNSVVTKLFSRPMFEGFTPATYPPTGTPSQFWASGRKPFMFMAKININSQLDTVLFVGLHAKAGSALDDYARRKYDVRAMYDTLQAQYPTRKTIVIGDLNDDVDKSIATTACNQLVSSYAPFLYTNPDETAVNGTRPNSSWNPISKILSDSYCASTASYPDYIDHQIISNELTGSGFGFKYATGSIASFRPAITNYANTTSDHYATVARYEFISPPPITSIATGNWSSPTTWDCNCVPMATDNVVIDTPHTVTVDAASQVKSINLKGILNYLAPFVLSLGQ